MSGQAQRERLAPLSTAPSRQAPHTFAGRVQVQLGCVRASGWGAKQHWRILKGFSAAHRRRCRCLCPARHSLRRRREAAGAGTGFSIAHTPKQVRHCLVGSKGTKRRRWVLAVQHGCRHFRGPGGGGGGRDGRPNPGRTQLQPGALHCVPLCRGVCCCEAGETAASRHTLW